MHVLMEFPSAGAVHCTSMIFNTSSYVKHVFAPGLYICINPPMDQCTLAGGLSTSIDTEKDY